MKTGDVLRTVADYEAVPVGGTVSSNTSPDWHWVRDADGYFDSKNPQHQNSSARMAMFARKVRSLPTETSDLGPGSIVAGDDGDVYLLDADGKTWWRTCSTEPYADPVGQVVRRCPVRSREWMAINAVLDNPDLTDKVMEALA